MTMQDPIADLLTRVRNAQAASHEDVDMPCSKIKVAICEVLKQEGYIDEFSVAEGAKSTLNVSLRYHHGRPVIEEIKRVSRPGLRVYKACDQLPDVRGGLGVAIVSTSRGVMTSTSARAQGMGGEVLCTVF
ncbi:MAG: 30S ribosomal protein S8 [Gammaproteobacteria bacterium]|nr:30S ribosomal protein S8 [Gammaproteobacteria bacterium]